ncbi:hypothetical protein, partial [uncultured Nostoc sp.]|uniref:hypothetical protein n=1 Tax=uncultured Nostoc sp. TaxID=340711 RepID=UPI0035CA120E
GLSTGDLIAGAIAVGSGLGAGDLIAGAIAVGCGLGCSGDRFGDSAFCCLGSGCNIFAGDKAVESRGLLLEALCASELVDFTAETGLFGKALPPAIESLVARNEVFWGMCVSLG